MRICVKGLPKGATEAQLRTHFAELGEPITDAKIARTRAGVSRQFGFVGFKTDAAAAAAVKRFNKSFMGTARLVVEPASDIDDATRVKLAWSRHTKRKEAAKASAGHEPAGAHVQAAPPGQRVGAPGAKDPQRLQEYLALATRVAKGPSWANDDARARGAVDGSGDAAEAEGASFAEPLLPDAAGHGGKKGKRTSTTADDDGNSTDSGEYAELPAVHCSGTDSADASAGPGSANSAATGSGGTSPRPPAPRVSGCDADFLKAHTVRGGFSDDTDDEEDEAAGGTQAGSVMRHQHGAAGAAPGVDTGSDTEAGGYGVGGNVGSSADDEGVGADVGNAAVRPHAERSLGGSQRRGGGVAAAPAAAAVAGGTDDDAAVAAEEGVGESGRLFVRNLPYSATDADVTAHFGRWGATADVKLVRDGRGRPTGCAYVLFVVPEHAVSALAGADGRVFQGRLLHVLPARPVPADHAARAEAAAAAATAAAAAASGGATKQSQYQRATDAAKRKAAGTAAEGGVSGNPWSALFVRADTTVAAIAEQLGIGRGELLLGGGGKEDEDDDAVRGGGKKGGSSMAVRLALAETELVAQTKRFLAAEGVDLPALEDALVGGSGTAKAAAVGAVGATGGLGVAPTPLLLRRSDRVVLIKNLPFTADLETLRELFSRHGSLSRFVMPPTRALAIAEYADPRQAKRAFAALAYARYQRAPLYLEWAPEALFRGPAAEAAASAAATAAVAAPAALAAAPVLASAAAATAAAVPSALGASGAGAATASAGNAAGVGAAARTLFIKNVSFATTEEGLRAAFTAAVGGAAHKLRAVRIPRRRNPKYRPLLAAGGGAQEPGSGGAAQKKPAKPAVAAPPPVGGSGSIGAGGQPEWLSMGYGFVEFETAEDAAAALRSMQGKELDGHALQLKVSANAGAAAGAGEEGTAAVPLPGVAAVAAGGKKGKAATRAAAVAAAVAPATPSSVAAAGPGTKLLVRNLAFEATAHDVRDLFAGFGTLKSCRLPKKFDGTHRGFAFVDFLTAQEAAAAKAALAATHLYGRHLVVEWAAAAGGGGEAGAEGGAAAAAGAGLGAGAGGVAGKRKRSETSGGSTAEAGKVSATTSASASFSTRKKQRP